MAIFDTLFKKKNSGADEMDLSVASEQDIARLAAESLASEAGRNDTTVDSMVAGTEEARLAEEGLVALPLLGSKPAAKHQRTLTVMLGAGILVLGAITLYVLSEPICVSAQHFLDGLFVGTLANLFAVMMVYKVCCSSFIPRGFKPMETNGLVLVLGYDYERGPRVFRGTTTT